MQKIEVFVEGEGLADVTSLEVPLGGTLRDIVVAAASRGGFSADDALLFLEDAETPLDLGGVVGDEARGRVHHVHRARTVEVSVSYQASTKTKSFPPSATIQRVLDWAVGPDGFGLDPTLAPEMELALHGQTQALPKTAHLGRFVRNHHHHLHLDLVRGVVPNGGV
jgi:hypothetical protein